MKLRSPLARSNQLARDAARGRRRGHARTRPTTLGPDSAYTGRAVVDVLGHGATNTNAMSHLAVWQFVDGSGGKLFEHVSDDDDLAEPSADWAEEARYRAA